MINKLIINNNVKMKANEAQINEMTKVAFNKLVFLLFFARDLVE